MVKCLGDLPLFTKRDLEVSRNPMDRVFRKICIDMGITHTSFRDMFVKQGKHFGWTDEKINQEFNNSKKAIWAENGISFGKFYKILTIIMDCEFESIEVKFKDAKGNLRSYTNE